MKICCTCKTEKDLNEFQKDKANKDGLRPDCKICCRNRKRKYYIKNRDKILKHNKGWLMENRESMFNYYKEWRLNNKESLYEYQKNRRNSNISCKLIHYNRTRINKVLKNNKKISRTIELLGCTIEKFKLHLESSFSKDMNWDNYGKWHVDHIIPCSSFDFSNLEEQKKCFHYTNLQPLWAIENLKKSNKILTKAK